MQAAIDPQLPPVIDGLDPSRPLIIFDVDEVICPTAKQFEQRLQAMNYRYEIVDAWFQNWIIKDQQERVFTADEIDGLLPTWLMPLLAEQAIYPEAKPIIDRLSAQANIVILTNLWMEVASLRSANFNRLGFDYPIIYWQGNKAPAIEALAARVSATAFVDDNHHHINAVRERLPEVYCDNFTANPVIRALAPPTMAQSSSNSWGALEGVLSRWLQGK